MGTFIGWSSSPGQRQKSLVSPHQRAPITAVEQAFLVIRTYARRWQLEMAWRYTKSELAFRSPRLWSWHNRLKLLLIAALAYAFLLSLLAPLLDGLRLLLLRHWCRRTGKRCRDASTPLYRLRAALARLWSLFLKTSRHHPFSTKFGMTHVHISSDKKPISRNYFSGQKMPR